MCLALKRCLAPSWIVMSWFSRKKAPKPDQDSVGVLEIPDDIWTKCPSCKAVLYTKDLRRNFGVCNQCDYHFRLKSSERIPLLVDRHSFMEIDSKVKSADPLNFKDSSKYKDRIKKAEKKSVFLTI